MDKAVITNTTPKSSLRSEERTAPCAMRSKINWALSVPPPAEQAPTLSTTPISVKDEKIAKKLNKWWDIESYLSNCNFTGQFKDQKGALMTLE